jgi:hypothetical protein
MEEQGRLRCSVTGFQHSDNDGDGNGDSLDRETSSLSAPSMKDLLGGVELFHGVRGGYGVV